MRKFVALRRELREVFAQIERGEYTEYDDHTIKDLAADIKDRGNQLQMSARRASAERFASQLSPTWESESSTTNSTTELALRR